MLLLTFIRALESFEVPLLIGTPGNLQTFTTAIYQTIHRGFVPRYGEASAYAVLLILIVALPLAGYYRVTRQAQKYATITGKGFRPARLDLGALRLPAGLYLLMMPLALVAPLLILLWASFLPLYEPPSVADFARLSLDNYRDVLTRPMTVDGLWNGVIVAGLSSTAVTASPSCWPGWWCGGASARAGCSTFWLAAAGAARHRARHRGADRVSAAPLIPIYGTIWIMVLAFLIRFMPYGIRFCYAGISSLHRASGGMRPACGAGTFTMLRRIVLPLTLPAVTAIWIYVFLYSIRDLSLPVMLAGPQNQLIAVVILDLWNDGKVPEVGALSVLLALTAAALGCSFMRLTRRYGVSTF